jgi:hypothetical protein
MRISREFPIFVRTCSKAEMERFSARVGIDGLADLLGDRLHGVVKVKTGAVRASGLRAASTILVASEY